MYCPKCKNLKKDCFALTKDNQCICLTETTFKDKEGNYRECPFYKKKDVKTINVKKAA